MKKIILAVVAVFIVSNVSFADLTVKEARSPERLKEEGYSNAVIQVVQREAGEYKPAPTNRYQRFGFKIWNYVDPASPPIRDAEPHDIKLYSHYEDL